MPGSTNRSWKTAVVTNSSRRPLALYGASATALLLAGTRWASYLPRDPIFLTDILLMGGVLLYVAHPKGRAPQYATRATFFWLLLTLAVFEMVLGRNYSLVALRDFVPYAYAFVGILSGASLRYSNPDQRLRTARLLRVALAFHAAWFTLVVTVLPGLPAAMPVISVTQDLHLFTPRNDIDGALTGVFAAILLADPQDLHRKRANNYVTVAAFVLCWIGVLAGGSRAGLFGALIANAYALASRLGRSQGGMRPKLLLIGVTSIAAAPALFLIMRSAVGSRLLGTFGYSSAANATQAAGTADARRESWSVLTSWILQSAHRVFIGVGFGPDFMNLSGADYYLVGTTAAGDTIPRSPHNYWLGTFAREGIIGLSLALITVSAILVVCWRRRREIHLDGVTFISAVVPLSLIIPATLGVVLESPFGAVPFYWCAGILFSTLLSTGPDISRSDPPASDDGTVSGTNFNAGTRRSRKLPNANYHTR